MKFEIWPLPLGNWSHYELDSDTVKDLLETLPDFLDLKRFSDSIKNTFKSHSDLFTDSHPDEICEIHFESVRMHFLSVKTYETH